jgi:hypothetical protein
MLCTDTLQEDAQNMKNKRQILYRNIELVAVQYSKQLIDFGT